MLAELQDRQWVDKAETSMSQAGKPEGEGQDELEEALRQLEQQQRQAAARPPPPREEVEEAVRRIAEQQREEREARAPSRFAKARWPVLGVAAAGFVVVVAILFWPEPLPPPAQSPTEAVRGFWSAVVARRYEAATIYWPGLVDRYGSRKQAARFLAETFRADPPTAVRNVELAGEVPDSSDVLVNCEVLRRSGRPITRQAVVRDSEDPSKGYIITGGI